MMIVYCGSCYLDLPPDFFLDLLTDGYLEILRDRLDSDTSMKSMGDAPLPKNWTIAVIGVVECVNS